MRAGDRLQPGAAAALEELCNRYWTAVYAYVRRRTRDVETAQDRTQAFFADLLERNLPAAADPERGRFRAFLLTSVKHFLLNEHAREQTQRRGGGVRRLSLDFGDGESRLRCEPADDATPEHLFERRWALTLLETVIARLEREYDAPAKRRHFELLRPALAGDKERLPYGEIGMELGLSAEAARQAATRLRRRYRELLRSEIAETVADPEDVDDEIRRLFEVLGRG